MNGNPNRPGLRITHLLSLLGIAAFCPAAVAQDSQPDEAPLLLRGFGTVALARSSNGDAELVRDISQPEGISRSWSGRNDSIAGLQANYRAGSTTEFVLQGVSHYRHDGGFSPELTWAFVKYDPTPRVSIRLGRLGTEFLMQSDSRMVGYSYLPIRPPIEFFGGLPINYGDGADVQVRWPLGEGVLRARLSASQAREKLPAYNLDRSRIREASLGFDGGPWQLRYNYAQATFAQDIESLDTLRAGLTLAGAERTAQALGLAGTTSRYNSLGIAYDDGNWQAQAVTNRIRHDVGLFQNSRASYVIVGYRFGSLTPYAGYARSKSKAKSPDAGLPASSPLSIGLAAVLAAAHQDQHTFTLGARWDFLRNMDLKVQLDMVRGEPSSVVLLHDVQPGWNGRTNVLGVALDFIF